MNCCDGIRASDGWALRWRVSHFKLRVVWARVVNDASGCSLITAYCFFVRRPNAKPRYPTRRWSPARWFLRSSEGGTDESHELASHLISASWALFVKIGNAGPASRAAPTGQVINSKSIMGSVVQILMQPQNVPPVHNSVQFRPISHNCAQAEHPEPSAQRPAPRTQHPAPAPRKRPAMIGTWGPHQTRTPNQPIPIALRPPGWPASSPRAARCPAGCRNSWATRFPPAA